MIGEHTLYVDNFRGFRDAYVPILDVNFLAGENSSGKTSLLSLLKLMSGPELLFGNEFQTDDIDFGGFRDIVSARTDDPSYFRIGMIRWDVTAKPRMPMAVMDPIFWTKKAPFLR